jgi:acetylornithine deacetylase/succinyl-diaminopimelate desuccinylase-like protein
LFLGNVKTVHPLIKRQEKRGIALQIQNLFKEVETLKTEMVDALMELIRAPAVVWNSVDEVANQPDEYAKIENMVNDAKIFALLVIS